jgi:ATP-dependent Lon protease
MSVSEELFLLPLENVVVFPECATVLIVTKKDEIDTIDK